MSKKIVAALITSIFVISPLLYADNLWDMAQSDSYGRKAGGMFGRGLLNAASCFIDLIVQTVDKTKDGPPIVGTLTGIGSGAACTVLRAGSGVVDVATFWVPGFNGVPVSKSYHNCIESEAAAPATPVTEQPSYTYQAPAPEPVRSEYSDTTHNAMKYVKK